MTMKETLHTLEKVKQAIELAYSLGYSAGKQQSKWQGLEAEDLAQIESDAFWQVGNHMAIAMAVEAKLKEKNT
jgi:hypothetical protein